MRFILALSLLFLLGGCRLDEQRLNHVVLVWFNDDVTQEQREKVKEESLKLKAISGLKTIQIGSAVQSERPVVDDSFDLGILMQFDSKEAMERYVDDPRHQAFIAEHIKGKVKQLRIYDF